MKWIFLCLVFVYTSTIGSAQDYFNLRERFGLPAAVHTKIIKKDSSVFIIGIAADSIFPYQTGSSLLRYDVKGNLLNKTFLLDTFHSVATWFPHHEFVSDTTFLTNAIYENGDFETNGSLIKWNLNGSINWQKRYDWPNEYAFFQNRGMTRLHDKLYFGNRLALGNQEENMAIQIVDLDGNLLDNKFIQLDDWGRLQTIERWGEILVVGGLRYIGTPGVLGHQTKSLLVGIDSLGNKLWEWVNEGDELGKIIIDIEQTHKGNIVATRANGIEVEINASSSAIQNTEHIIFELDKDLNLVWEMVFNEASWPTGYNHFGTIHKSYDGSGYIAGGSILRIGPNQTSDILGYLAKVSLTGDSLWTRKVQFYQDDVELDSLSKYQHRIYDIDETPSGDILIVGEAAEQADYPQQAWFMKVDEHGCLVPGCHLINAVNEENEQTAEWLIAPNPVVDRLNVHLGDFRPNNKSELLLFDVNAKLLRKIPVRHPNTSYSIPVQSLSSGTYFLSWRMDGEIVSTEQVVKL